MTIRDLIEQLQRFDPEWEVWVSERDSFGIKYISVGGVVATAPKEMAVICLGAARARAEDVLLEHLEDNDD